MDSLPTSSPGKSASVNGNSRSSPTFDPAAVAVAIARAHARNDLRKERAAEEKAGSNRGAGGAHDPVGSEAAGKCDGSFSSPELNGEAEKANGPASVADENHENEAAVAGERTAVTSDDAPKSAGATAADANENGDAERRSLSEKADNGGSTGPAAAGKTREDALVSASVGTGEEVNGGFGIQDAKHHSAGDVGAEISGGVSSQPNGYNRETSATTAVLEKQKEEEAKKGERERNDEILIESAAALRLKSLDLDLLPLSYHGCRTKVGQPSDTCIQERADRRAIEEAAAAAGRYARPHSPSHPAWVGRNANKATTSGGADGGAGAGAGAEEVLHPTFWGFKTDREPGAADLVRLSRSFNLDLTSQVLHLYEWSFFCLRSSFVSVLG